jgi:hypothetical protein
MWLCLRPTLQTAPWTEVTAGRSIGHRGALGRALIGPLVRSNLRQRAFVSNALTPNQLWHQRAANSFTYGTTVARFEERTADPSTLCSGLIVAPPTPNR